MEKVIVEKEQPLVLFFPDSPARPGMIECWDAISGHGDASLGYFWGLKKPGADQDQALIKRYEQHYNTKLKKAGKMKTLEEYKQEQPEYIALLAEQNGGAQC